MIDANSQFFAILTNVGRAKQANADALGVPWKFTQMGLGDANNTDPIPSAEQTSLINEWRRRPLNQVRVDPVNPAVIIAEQIIPADEGGRWIREIGLYDADGDLVAVANCAPSFKPVLSQGSGRTQVVRMNFIVASTGNITLKIDPAVVLATRDYVDSRILEELYKLDSKQSVRVATTANIALAGLQTLDGVALVAGDRVLVKNQTVAKDNGLYLAAAAVWTRAPDADSNAEVTSALLTSVEQGATQADTRWQLVTDGLIVLGTTALTFQNVTQGFAPINSPALISPTSTSTPAQFDASKLLATTEFVQRAIGSYAGQTNYPGDTVLTAADVGKLSNFAQLSVVTLPPAASVEPGGLIIIGASIVGGVTVKAGGTDTLTNLNTNPGPFNIQVGSIGVFRRLLGGNGWSFDGGDAALRYSPLMLGANWFTQPQFDAGKSFATTEFVQRALGSHSGGRSISVGSAITLTIADVGLFISLSLGSAQTATLPLLADVAVGATMTLHNPTGVDKTVVTTGTDKISPDGAQYGFITLRPGETAYFTKETGVWRLHGSPALRYSKTLTGADWTTQAQFDNGKSIATTEFVQRALGSFNGYTAVAASRSLTVADIGKFVWLSNLGPFTLTLPAPSALGVPFGASFTVFATSTQGTLLTSGGTTIQEQAGALVTSFLIKSGQSARLVATATNQWMVTDSSANLGKNADFACLKSMNGWLESPSGLTEQWGPIPAIPANSSVLVTFPKAFTTGAVGYALASGGSGAGVPGVNVQNVSETQVRFWNQSTTASTQAGGYRVIGF